MGTGVREPPKLMILAQPKSASTSLMHAVGTAAQQTFGQQYHVPNGERHPLSLTDRVMRRGGQVVLRLLKSNLRLVSEEDQATTLKWVYPASHYGALSRVHSDICDLRAVERIQDVLIYAVHKQHFPPTDANVALLADVPKVLLLRDVTETLEAYTRVPREEGNPLFIGLRRNSLFREALARELHDWQAGWIRALANKSDILTIWKDDLVARPAHHVNSVLGLMGATGHRVPDHYQLPKKRVYRPLHRGPTSARGVPPDEQSRR